MNLVFFPEFPLRLLFHFFRNVSAFGYCLVQSPQEPLASCTATLLLFAAPLLLNKLLDLLVPVSLTYLYAYTPGLSPRRLQGVLLFSDGISLLEVGFTLRCLQRLSLPDLATLPCSWSATDAPAVRPFRSSRTKNSSSQISYAHDG